MDTNTEAGSAPFFLELLSWQTTIAWLLIASVFGVALILSIFVSINGISRLEHGYSGIKIRRWSIKSIIAHWLGAIPCLFLILTGLILGAGKAVFDTHSDWWGPFVNLAANIHEFMGFPFILGAIAMISMWWRQQLFVRYDLDWFKQMGGYINNGKHNHPDAGFSSGGEKMWFWTFTACFLVLATTGLVLFFPQLHPNYNIAPLIITLHIASAMLLGAFAVVHIFMAAVMSQGAIKTMITGYCDSNWAKQHHNRWFETVKK